LGLFTPWCIRALLGYDKRLCAATLAAFVKECFHSLKRRAKAWLGLSSVRHALAGAVAAIQRTDSSLRLNVHFHVLVLDGVYTGRRPHPTVGRPASNSLGLSVNPVTIVRSHFTVTIRYRLYTPVFALCVVFDVLAIVS
jgi:Putative transposase